MAELTDEKRGKIALAILRQKAREKGIQINPMGIKRDMGNLAKATGFSKEELALFLEEECQMLLEETFRGFKKD